MNTRLKALTEGAILVAMAAVLNPLKIGIWADGGSVDLIMIPIVVFAVRRGLGWGLGAGLAYGFIDFMLSGRGLTWQSILLDYFVAFTMLGLAGLFKGKKHGMVWGSLVGGLGRFVCHYISGVVVWGAWMPEAFFGMTMTTPAFYSLLYNGSYMAVNILASMVVCKLLEKPMEKMLPVNSTQ